MPDRKDDVFSRTEYRRVIAWPARIQREAPFLEGLFADAPVKRFLDLGCGTGEHSRHFAEKGWTAVGVDLSEKMIEDATELAGETEAGGSARYELRDMADAGTLPETPFGAALCVGNTLAFAESEAGLDRAIKGVAAALAPGATFLIQMLNYDRLEANGARHLPLNFRALPEEEGEGEIVFLRMLTPRGGRAWDFLPITLTVQPDAEEPVRLRSAKRSTHWTWRRGDLEGALRRAGFGRIRALGGLSDQPFSPKESVDLVMVAERE